MIGIAQYDVRTRRPHFGGAHGLDGRRCAHGHEGGRTNFAAQHVNAAGAGLAIGGGNGKLESRGHVEALGG